MNPIPSKAQNPTGLHQRYTLLRLDGTPVDTTKADYFVLRLDDGGSDPHHVAACRAAILTYAAHIAPTIPKLAEDIRARYGTTPAPGWPKHMPKGVATQPISKGGEIVERPGKATEEKQ